jgi:uncharacterized membrane protein YdbT with pleckstrin-like domain
MELAQGESLLFEGHPSWRSILAFYLKGVVIAIIVAAIAYFATGSTASWGGVGLLVVLAVVVVAGLIKRISTSYKVSDQRLWIRHGILSRSVEETRLTRVQGVNTHQTLLQRILRVGTVEFDTAASDDFEYSFVGVADPEHISRRVNDVIRQMPVHG